MGVFIKGMEMPKNCEECDIHFCKLWMRLTISQRIEGKHPDCPLVEVKEPHGRLVDADKLLVEHSLKLTEEFAPTVIEAEGSET